MSQPRWIEVNLSTVLVPDAGWHYDDDVTMRKLAASLQRHGQLEPLVVRGDPADDSLVTLVRGHKLLGAMLALGWTKAMAVHVGNVDPMQALKIALHLELRFEVDYAALADAICQLVAGGATAAELASGSPFDEERIQHFMTLRTWDWSQFRQDDGQARLDWDALSAPAAEETDILAPPIVRDELNRPMPPEPLATNSSERESAQVAAISPALDAMLDAAATVIDRTRPHTTPEQVAAAMADALEDVTAEATAGPPAVEPAARPAASEPAAATASEAAAKPAAPAKAKPAKAAKVPKAPEAQMGLF